MKRAGLRLPLDFLRARVGRRVTASFVGAALLPVGAYAGISYFTVTIRLRDQAEEALTDLADNTGQSILGRLSFLEARVDAVSALAVAEAVGGVGAPSTPVADLLPPDIEGFAIAYEGEMRQLAGTVGEVPALDSREKDHLADGGAVVKTARTSDAAAASVYLALSAGLGDPDEGVLWARITGDSLWASGKAWMEDSAIEDFCVLDADLRPLFCLRGASSSLPRRVPPAEDRADVTHDLLLPDEGGGDDVGAWHYVPLRAFNADLWMVLVSEPSESVYSALGLFRWNVVLVLLIIVTLVTLLSNISVRQTLDPLEKLTEGTRRIAGHDLSTRVDVERRDEFGALASSFNTMAERLGHQFRQIEAGRAIDQAVLSASDRRVAVEALLNGMGEIAAAERGAVLLLESGADGEAVLYFKASVDSTVLESSPPIWETDRTWLGLSGTRTENVEVADLPDVLRSAGFGRGASHVLVLRLIVQGEPLGAVAVEHRDGGRFPEAEVGRAERLVDQAAVALNELKLRRDLEEMSWEALRALANAIDAKSKWTAGHSQRVTNLSLELGQRVELGDQDMEILHRGALLHDVGKIGVPARVLDWAGPLDAEMRRMIEAHPVIGARILEPIRHFQPILPIVLHHHERWDGQGYPDGLAGHDIHRLARLVAVADNFDAMVSARPYREAMSPRVVLGIIKSSAGTGLDPDFVNVMEQLMNDGWLPGNVEIEMRIAVDG